MIKRIPQNTMGTSNRGWLNSLFHFSFAEYYNPRNIHFGALRVINDDLIAPQTGFDTHPHKDMEIISYVVDGTITHKDSMGNQKDLTRGNIQYMSAGTGVLHSEYNNHAEELRLLQIWILPDKEGNTPQYGDKEFKEEDRINQWLHLVSGIGGEAEVQIHQDVNMYVTELDEGKELTFHVEQDRQAYIVQIEGKSTMNGTTMFEQDGMEVIEEELSIQALTQSHILIIEMAKM